MREPDLLLKRGTKCLKDIISGPLKIRIPNKGLLVAVAVIMMLEMPLIFFGALGMPTEARINNKDESSPLAAMNKVSPEEVDPLEKIGKGIISDGNEEKISRENEKIKIPTSATEENRKNDLNYDLLVGYPIEQMVPFIEKQDRNIASLVVAIAKKESDWGRYSPRLAGQDCFNYWGLKGKGRTVGSGYRCFETREEAVQAVSDKLGEFAAKGMDTPAKLLVWKCGPSCASHDPKDVQRWVGDINKYWQLIKS
jgi:hypothetical protein